MPNYTKEGEEYCPHCGNPTASMGILGNLVHYRCRYCGAEFATERVEGVEYDL